MKRILPAVLAVLLLLSLAACRAAPPSSTAETGTASETGTAAPETAEQTTAPGAQESETVPAAEGAASVTDAVSEGGVEESVSYRLSVPQVAAENEAAGQTISDYYESVAGKLTDLAYGEVYEQSGESHSVMLLSADYEVPYNRDGILSVLRSVTVSDKTEGAAQSTWYAETFNLRNGGLYTLDDFFSVPEDEYRPRLVQAVRAQIGDDPQHGAKYFDRWQELTQSAFDKNQFYFTGDALAVFYQQGDLGADGSAFFLLPVSGLQDIFRLPQ